MWNGDNVVVVLVLFFLFIWIVYGMKWKGWVVSVLVSLFEGKKIKVGGENDFEIFIMDSRMVDFIMLKRVVEMFFVVVDLEIFFIEIWEKKFYFVKWVNIDFYGVLFFKKDLEIILKKEEIYFIEDINLSCYVEGKMELLNEEGFCINLKYIKVIGVFV